MTPTAPALRRVTTASTSAPSRASTSSTPSSRSPRSRGSRRSPTGSSSPGKVGRAKSKFDNPVQTTTTLDALNVNGYAIDFRDSDRLPTHHLSVRRHQHRRRARRSSACRSRRGTQPATIPTPPRARSASARRARTTRSTTVRGDLAWELTPDVSPSRAGLTTRSTISRPSNSAASTRTTPSSRRRPALRSRASPPVSPASATGSACRRHADLLGDPEPQRHRRALQHLLQLPAVRPCRRPGRLHAVLDHQRQRPRQQPRGDRRGYAAATLMVDFTTELFGMPLRGNIGVRYVKTESAADRLPGDGRRHADHRRHESYDDWLPSLNLAMRRRPATSSCASPRRKVMARPQLGNLIAGRLDHHDRQPHDHHRQPVARAVPRQDVRRQLRVVLRARTRSCRLGLFYKDIDTYIQTLRTNVPYNQTGLPLTLLPANFTGNEVFQVTDAGQHRGRAAQGLRDQLPAALHASCRASLAQLRHDPQLHLCRIEDRVPGLGDQRGHDHRRPPQPVAAQSGTRRCTTTTAASASAVSVAYRSDYPAARAGAEQQRRRGQELRRSTSTPRPPTSSTTTSR